MDDAVDGMDPATTTAAAAAVPPSVGAVGARGHDALIDAQLDALQAQEEQYRQQKQHELELAMHAMDTKLAAERQSMEAEFERRATRQREEAEQKRLVAAHNELRDAGANVDEDTKQRILEQARADAAQMSDALLVEQEQQRARLQQRLAREQERAKAKERKLREAELERELAVRNARQEVHSLIVHCCCLCVARLVTEIGLPGHPAHRWKRRISSASATRGKAISSPAWLLYLPIGALPSFLPFLFALCAQIANTNNSVYLFAAGNERRGFVCSCCKPPANLNACNSALISDVPWWSARPHCPSLVGLPLPRSPSHCP